MGLSMTESGKMTSRRGMEKKNGRMEHFTKEITNKARNKAKGFSSGAMTAHTKDNFGRTTSTARENILGRMVGCTREIGRTTKWMGKGCSHGQMGANTKENT